MNNARSEDLPQGMNHHKLRWDVWMCLSTLVKMAHSEMKWEQKICLIPLRWKHKGFLLPPKSLAWDLLSSLLELLQPQALWTAALNTDWGPRECFDKTETMEKLKYVRMSVSWCSQKKFSSLTFLQDLKSQDILHSKDPGCWLPLVCYFHWEERAG